MKKLCSVALVLALCFAFCGAAAADGGIGAAVDYDHSSPVTEVSFVFVDEDENELQSITYDDVCWLDGRITVRVEAGSITKVEETEGEIDGLEGLGSRQVSFTWSGERNMEEVIKITVSGLASEIPTAPLTVSLSDAKAMLASCGIALGGELEILGGTLILTGAGRFELTAGEDGLYGELPQGTAIDGTGALELSCLLGSASSDFRIYAEAYRLSYSLSEGYRIEPATETHTVRFMDKSRTITERAVPDGAAIGELPDGGEGFAGWEYNGELISESFTVTQDMLLTAVYSEPEPAGDEPEEEEEEEEETPEEVVYIDRSAFCALDAFGDWDDGSLRAALVGENSRGNENYGGSYWLGDYYVLSNCSRSSDEGTEGENTYVPIDELTHIVLFAGYGEEEISMRVSVGELEFDGRVFSLAEEAEPFMELDLGRYAYMQGRGGGIFAPEGNITRAEAAQLMLNCLTEESRASLSERPYFSDVLYSSWYYDAVTLMAGAGGIDARADGRFDPDTPITRAEFTALAMRALGAEPGYGVSFTDIYGHRYSGYISSAVTLGVINGYGDGSFRPDAPITRAEAAKIMNRILKRSGQPRYITEYLDVPPSAWYYNEIQLATSPW